MATRPEVSLHRHAERYRQILVVLVRYGFGELIQRARLRSYLLLRLGLLTRGSRQDLAALSTAERVRRALTELGPTFVKMGQVLSTRPDLLPVAFVQELSKLQDEVPPFSFSAVRDTVEDELGVPLEESFPRFDPRPLAAASIGQVHRACLPDTTEVVVKVQRPDLQKTIAADLAILSHLARRLEKPLGAWGIHRPARVVEELSRTLQAELDYTREAAQMERFRRCFAADPTVHAPGVYWERTTARLLTMDYVPGVKVSDLEGLEREGLDRREVARRGADLMAKQVFLHGFFHADPHPGNLCVLPDHVICFLDFGVTGEISPRERADVAELLQGLLRRDAAASAGALIRLTATGGEPDRKALERDLRELGGEPFGRPSTEPQLGRILLRILEIATVHRLSVPPHFFLILKSLAAADGLGRMLDPEFNLLKHVATLVQRLSAAPADSRQAAEEIFDSAAEALLRLREMPGELHDLMERLGKGGLTVRLAPDSLARLSPPAAGGRDRLAAAIALGSLVIGSSIVTAAGAPPLWQGTPVLAWAGYALAALFGLRLWWRG